MLLLVCAYVLAAMAAPLSGSSDSPSNSTTIIELEKRTTHTGRGTWYYPGLGNCGYTDDSNDDVVAMSKAFYDNNGGSNCNQWIQIKNTKNGKVAYGKMRDSCPGCGYNDLDMSPAVFKQLGTLDQGVLSISWHFEAKGWSP